MQGQNIFMNNDFSKVTSELRKNLLIEVERLWKLGKNAYLNYTIRVSRVKSGGGNVKTNIKLTFSLVNKDVFKLSFES